MQDKDKTPEIQQYHQQKVKFYTGTTNKNKLKLQSTDFPASSLEKKQLFSQHLGSKYVCFKKIYCFQYSFSIIGDWPQKQHQMHNSLLL